MLGQEVRVFVVLGLVKHVFAEHALVQTGRSNAGDMVEVPGIDGLGQFHRVARAFDVDGDLAVFVSPQVVHRSEVVEVVDLPFQGLDGVGAHAQLLGGEVAKHRHRARFGGAPAQAPVLAQRRHLALAFGADQEVHHRALARQQLLDKPFADEAGGAGDEVVHCVSPEVVVAVCSPPFLRSRQRRRFRTNPRPD